MFREALYSEDKNYFSVFRARNEAFLFFSQRRVAPKCVLAVCLLQSLKECLVCKFIISSILFRSYEFHVKPRNPLGEGPSSNVVAFSTESGESFQRSDHHLQWLYYSSLGDIWKALLLHFVHLVLLFTISRLAFYYWTCYGSAWKVSWDQVCIV